LEPEPQPQRGQSRPVPHPPPAWNLAPKAQRYFSFSDRADNERGRGSVAAHSTRFEHDPEKWQPFPEKIMLHQKTV
jgi:hypothetical protein